MQKSKAKFTDHLAHLIELSNHQEVSQHLLIIFICYSDYGFLGIKGLVDPNVFKRLLCDILQLQFIIYKN